MVDSNNLDDVKNLWSKLLEEVKEKSSVIRQIPNSLLVLGNEMSGKSSLIARLQKSDVKNGVGLEFEFIDVKDESVDANKQLNVWILPGDTFYSNLLKYALDENNFGYTFCMITVSIAEPWTIIENLKLWLEILSKHINRLKLSQDEIMIYKDTLFRHFQEYCENEIDIPAPILLGKRRDTSFNFLHPNSIQDLGKNFVPLSETVLEKNLGLPIIVVVTKTDQIVTLEQEHQYDDDKFDFIQMHVRKLCLQYGAALCYISIKDNRNCEILLQYILHRCYGFPFMNTASVIDKDGIFIPAGWDNNNKINILAKNLPLDVRNQTFDSFITKPLSVVSCMTQNRLNDPEMAEDEQIFLMKQHAQLQQLKTVVTSDKRSNDAGRGQLPKPRLSARNRKIPSGHSNVGINVASPGSQGNDGVLANFFSSLLHNRTASGIQPLNSQQSTTSDPGRFTGNSSEAEDSYKDDLKVSEISDSLTSDIEENRQSELCEDTR